MADDRTRTVDINALGRDSLGEPTAQFFGPYDPDNEFSRYRIYVIPITEAEHLHLSEALPRSESGLVEFEVPQSRVTMAVDAQALRGSPDGVSADDT